MRTSSLAAGIVYLMYTSEKCVSSIEFVRAFQRKNNIDRYIERTKWNKFYADRKFCVDKICVFMKFLAPTTRNRKHFFCAIYICCCSFSLFSFSKLCLVSARNLHSYTQICTPIYFKFIWLSAYIHTNRFRRYVFQWDSPSDHNKFSRFILSLF